MAALDVQFANAGIRLVGGNAINSFNDGSLEANVASTLYEDTVQDLLTRHPWRFATKKFGPLSQDATAPANEYDYSYTLPADLKVLLAVQPEYIDYDNFQDKKLFTGFDGEIYVEGLIRPDESQFPPYFRQLLKFELASVFAVPITEDSTKASEMEKKADKLFMRARRTDSQTRRNVLSTRPNPLTNVR